MTVSAKKLAVIHIVKKELGLTDEAYREILRSEAGVESAKDLDDAGFQKLMKRFVRSPRYRLQPGGITLRQKLFIDSLASELGWAGPHLVNFVKKYYHHHSCEELTRGEASKLIESLKSIRAKAARGQC